MHLASLCDPENPSIDPKQRAIEQDAALKDLEAMVNDAVGRHSAGVLSLSTFREKIGKEIDASAQESLCPTPDSHSSISFGDSLPTLAESESHLINEALLRANNNQTIAAKILGISRRALNNRLSRKSNSK